MVRRFGGVFGSLAERSWCGERFGDGLEDSGKDGAGLLVHGKDAEGVKMVQEALRGCKVGIFPAARCVFAVFKICLLRRTKKNCEEETT